MFRFSMFSQSYQNRFHEIAWFAEPEQNATDQNALDIFSTDHVSLQFAEKIVTAWRTLKVKSGYSWRQ